MKFRRPLLIIAPLVVTVVILSGAQAVCAEEFTGLFGIALDAPCEVCESGEAMEAGDSPLLQRYRVTPPAPESGLELYQVRTAVAPEKIRGRVVDISAVALIKDEDAAARVFAALQERFEQELGRPALKKFYNAKSAAFSRKGSDRVLILMLRKDDFERHWVLFVNAMDRGLFARVRKEAAKQKDD